jgi:hypothetical protein
MGQGIIHNYNNVCRVSIKLFALNINDGDTKSKIINDRLEH